MSIKIVPSMTSLETVSSATNTSLKYMTCDNLHQLLGHPGESKLQETAKLMNFSCTG
jgi:hypothetical protein